MPSLADHIKAFAIRLAYVNEDDKEDEDILDDSSEEIRQAAVESVNRAWEAAERKGVPQQEQAET